MTTGLPKKCVMYSYDLNDSQSLSNNQFDPQKHFRLDIEERYSNNFDINCVEFDHNAVKLEICFKNSQSDQSKVSATAHIDNDDYSEVIKDVLNRAMEMVYSNFIIDHKS